MKKSTATDVNKYQKLNSTIYMIDFDQRPDSNRRPLLKSTPTVKNSDYSKVSCPMPLAHLIRDMKSRNIVTI
jgi:hypothetical protein